MSRLTDVHIEDVKSLVFRPESVMYSRHDDPFVEFSESERTFKIYTSKVLVR